MASWLSMCPVVGGAAIVAAQRNFTGRVHICWVCGGAVLCNVLTSCMRFRSIELAFLRNSDAI